MDIIGKNYWSGIGENGFVNCDDKYQKNQIPPFVILKIKRRYLGKVFEVEEGRGINGRSC